ncbi:metallophosphoesterase family protein [Haloprofundus sp. MHR1]|uniref:metallophosphoesterase family protein n=1 Tax=Haloprofundus sp. MHR1 TaxID=2572921 RepID=UPI0010BE3CF1|nr:metallophosphoesterase family protein [Haloprofundus sp. MHR1]
MPSSADDLPEWVRTRLADADYTLHTGEFDSVEAYETVLALTDGMLTAVAGDADPSELDLQPVEAVELEGVTFVVTRDRARLADAVRERLDGAPVGDDSEGDLDVVGVLGDDHDPTDERVDGVRVLRPGSATGAPPTAQPTMFVAQVEDGEYETALRPYEELQFD